MDENRNKVLNPHIGWIIFILILIIAYLAIRMPNGEKVVNYISFSSSITSLILAVIAISYSLFSNEGLSNSVKKLAKLTKSINSYTEKIQIDLEHFSTRSSEILTQISDVPTKIDDLSQTLTTQLSSNDKAIDSVTTTKDAIKKYELPINTTGAFIAFYSACMSYKSHKSFCVKEITEDEHGRGYISGSLNLFKLFCKDIITINEVDKKYFVSWMNEKCLNSFFDLLDDIEIDEPTQTTISKINTLFQKDTNKKAES